MSSAAAQQDGSPALAVDGLVAGYGGVIALDGVSISAGTAAITAVLGANGAGKTTLLRAISGMIKPRRGRVLLGGHDMAGHSPEQVVRAGIAHVPEGQGVIPELTVEENLRIGMMSWPAAARRVAGRSRADRGTALDEAFERFPPLAARRRKLAAALSGGERQMLAVCHALLKPSAVLLFDEVSSGLAPGVVARLSEVISGLRQPDRTIVVVEQYLHEVMRLADFVYVLRRGEVSFAGESTELTTAGTAAVDQGE